MSGLVSGWLTRVSWAGGTFSYFLAMCPNPAFHGGGGSMSPLCSKGEGAAFFHPATTWQADLAHGKCM